MTAVFSRRKVSGSMLTKNDWKKLEEKFATKEDLKGFKKEILEAIISFKDAILHEIPASV